MRFTIIHETTYEFSSEVFLEPHYLRFKPNNTIHIELESFKLNIIPSPSGLTEHIDAENNLVHLCWFEGLHKKVMIKSELLLNSMEYNPFDFILYPGEYLNLPFLYDGELQEILQPSLTGEPVDTSLLDFGRKVMDESNANTLTFLANLTRTIHSDFNLVIRELGGPNTADKTFNAKIGSCRDLAWMQIVLLRHMGFAARFVSGYYFLPLENADFELHAWIEVFLPGAGWIGFDPSHGIAAGNTHIPVASSSKPENTMAVSGTIRGDAKSTLNTKLTIKVI